MEKRVRFESRWLPYALVAPQIAITIVFFFLARRARRSTSRC